MKKYYTSGEWTQEKTSRAVIDLCKRIDKYAHFLTFDDMKNCQDCRMIPDLGNQTVSSVVSSLKNKINKGLENENEQIFLHTGPHHDKYMSPRLMEVELTKTQKAKEERKRQKIEKEINKLSTEIEEIKSSEIY